MEIAEAIKFLEDEESEWWGYCCPVPVSDCGDKADFREALDMAIAALRAQQEAKSPCAACGYGGKHLDAPPCTNCPAHPKKAEKNERLTLAELRTMDGQPVWCNDSKVWGIVGVDWDFSGNPFLMGRFNRDEFVWDIKQRNLPCYRYPPKEVQHDA